MCEDNIRLTEDKINYLQTKWWPVLLSSSTMVCLIWQYLRGFHSANICEVTRKTCILTASRPVSRRPLSGLEKMVTAGFLGALVLSTKLYGFTSQKTGVDTDIANHISTPCTVGACFKGYQSIWNLINK